MILSNNFNKCRFCFRFVSKQLFSTQIFSKKLSRDELLYSKYDALQIHQCYLIKTKHIKTMFGNLYDFKGTRNSWQIHDEWHCGILFRYFKSFSELIFSACDRSSCWEHSCTTMLFRTRLPLFTNFWIEKVMQYFYHICS